jgi:hypothetical protein
MQETRQRLITELDKYHFKGGDEVRELSKSSSVKI